MGSKGFLWKIVNLIALLLFITFNGLIRNKENFVADDTLMQLASAEAWRQGHGVSILYSNENDRALVSPRVVEFWPPGYAILTGTILQLTSDVQSANFLVDLVGLILFFTAWYLIGTSLIPFTVPYFPGLLMLPWAFGLLFNWLPTTDLLALSSYVLSMACLTRWVADTDGRKKVIWLGLCAVSAFGACFIRFAYYPLAFVPATVLFLGAAIGNRSWWRPGLWLLALTTVLVGGQVLYQHFIAGSLNYVTERHAASQPQIHWYNLRQFTPFLTKAIPGANRLPFPEKATDLLLLLGLTVGCLVVLSEARKTTTYARQVLYTWLWVAFLAFWLNILFMVFLSLRYPPEQWGPWTYVQEVRYFGLNMAISCSLLMLVLFWKYRAIPKYLQYGLKAIALVIFAQGYAFGTFKYRVNEPIAPNEGLQIAAVMKHWVENSPGRVVLATDQVHNYWGNGDLVASMAIYGAIGGASICHIEPFIRSHYCSEPVTVLVALVYNTPPPGLDQLYREGNARQVGTVGKGIPLMRLSFPATAPAPSALFDTKATLR